MWVEKLALSKNPLGHFPDQVSLEIVFIIIFFSLCEIRFLFPHTPSLPPPPLLLVQVTVALTNLRQLWLNECLLSDIPPSIGRLRKLEDLSIANNLIEVRRLLTRHRR